MIKFGGVFNNTGYGIAARDTAYALISNGLNITIQQLDLLGKKDSSSFCQSIVNRYFDRKLDSHINIAQVIPPMWHKVFEEGKYNVGCFFWETDKICNDWVKILNDKLTNEVWVPCEFNKQACINSGVKKPIFIIPQCTTLLYDDAVPCNIKLGSDDAFKFYSIFQWTERKNGAGLVRAYIKEFNQEDNVILVLKTYTTSMTAPEKEKIKKEIINLKNSIKKKNQPPIYLITDDLRANVLRQIHLKCDCYVTANRGEGWGMPVAEAMSANKPIITTKIGGLSQLLDNRSAYIIPHTLEKVRGMPWIQWYSSEQQWGYINDIDIMKSMREAYSDRNNFNIKTKYYPDILEAISMDSIGQIIEDRIWSIIKENNILRIYDENNRKKNM